jgi:3',5'-cyclic AMP phosphodiesterase CpdA
VRSGWRAPETGGVPILTLAHLSDLHATEVSPSGVLPLLGKRGLGFLSWHLRRRRAHRAEVLEALLRDLEQSRPDHVVVTGDLTNVSLPEEFVAARGWLTRLGSPDRVTAVPGNHDAYVRIEEARSIALWSEYLVSDPGGQDLLLEVCALEKTEAIGFPSVRLLAGVALVGLCSALPTPLFHATGEIGEAQLARLEAVLAELGARGYLRVVLVHHPPAPGSVSARRALRDGEALCAVLRRCGAELVLHGHLHRTRVDALQGPAWPIPVVGGRSASHGGGGADRLARYHLFGIGGRAAAPRIVMREREYDPQAGAFREVGPPEGVVLAQVGSHPG